MTAAGFSFGGLEKVDEAFRRAFGPSSRRSGGAVGVRRPARSGGSPGELSKTVELVKEAIRAIEDERYSEGEEYVKRAIETTSCNACKRKLVSLGAELAKMQVVCQIDEEECKESKEAVLKKLKFLKDEYIPAAEELAEKSKSILSE